MKISITVNFIFLFSFCILYFINALEFAPDYLTYCNQVIPKASHAEKFEIYGDKPADYATGIPQINIPYNSISASDAQHDYCPVNFNYNFAGNSGNFIFDLNGVVVSESRMALKLNKTMTGQVSAFTTLDSNVNNYSFNQTKEFNIQNVYLVSATFGSLSFDRGSYTDSWLFFSPQI